MTDGNRNERNESEWLGQKDNEANGQDCRRSGSKQVFLYDYCLEPEGQEGTTKKVGLETLGMETSLSSLCLIPKAV